MRDRVINRIGKLEKEYVQEVLNSNFQNSKNANMMGRLESAFVKRFGGGYGVSFVNGTATMHAALEAMGVGQGDEVIVPPLTMSATTFAVLQANATPIFADVDQNTFQIDVKSIEKLITVNTKAIITVALYGLCPDMDRIMQIAKAKNIKVIEDNAECFLGEYKGRLVGTFGDCSSFSFQSSKHLTSGEGGIILTTNLELAEKIRRIQSLGYAGVSATKGKILKSDIQDPTYSRHTSMGWNYRMPELCCAVALAQVERIDELVNHRIDCAKFFSDAVENFKDWFTPQLVEKEYKNSYWTWVAVLKRDDISWNVLRDQFAENGGDGVYSAWKLTYLEPMFKEMNLLGREKYISNKNLLSYQNGLCPVAEWLQPRLFQFKTNYMDISQAEKQAEILYKTLQKYN
jgi:perosamine synthetase